MPSYSVDNPNQNCTATVIYTYVVVNNGSEEAIINKIHAERDGESTDLILANGGGQEIVLQPGDEETIRVADSVNICEQDSASSVTLLGVEAESCTTEAAYVLMLPTFIDSMLNDPNFSTTSSVQAEEEDTTETTPTPTLSSAMNGACEVTTELSCGTLDGTNCMVGYIRYLCTQCSTL